MWGREETVYHRQQFPGCVNQPHELIVVNFYSKQMYVQLDCERVWKSIETVKPITSKTRQKWLDAVGVDVRVGVNVGIGVGVSWVGVQLELEWVGVGC